MIYQSNNYWTMSIFNKKGIVNIGDKNNNSIRENKCKKSFMSGVITGLLFPIISGIVVELFIQGETSNIIGWVIDLFR